MKEVFNLLLLIDIAFVSTVLLMSILLGKYKL